ncbi:hypothetical protein [Azotobacter salinestris]|uniref:hypothetical protein n=1 Tax=Azotobacter salinestris TaxID=69964 RepID=UPI001266DACE|nr:hypothetical protein [Azotobacter salinestris]
MNKQPFLPVLAALLAGPVLAASAVELDLGYFDLASCREVGWKSDGPFGPTSPTFHYGTQKIVVQAIVEGPNINLESHLSTVRECSKLVSTRIGMSLLAWPARSNELFRTSLLRCLDERNYPDEIFAVALKTKSLCTW